MACVVVVFIKVVVDLPIVLLVDNDLGFSEFEDPHAASKPTLNIDTNRFPPKVSVCSSQAALHSPLTFRKANLTWRRLRLDLHPLDLKTAEFRRFEITRHQRWRTTTMKNCPTSLGVLLE